jgi:broad specificity phosphatase PhoE
MSASGDSPVRTIVHLVRHGLVENPKGVLYGRLEKFFLSELGHQMAERAAAFFADRDVTHLRCSPLERAQQTMEPIQRVHQLPVIIDGRVIEAQNFLEGQRVGLNLAFVRQPKNWWYFRNPLRPTWGEPYPHIVERMQAAMKDAVDVAAGHEAVIVSHQLPIWMARCAVEGRRLAHDPRQRQCSLASVTSFTFQDGRIVSVSYAEPAGDLLPAIKGRKCVAGA